MTNKMQTFGLFICTQSVLRVSGDVFAHHQEPLTVFTAFDTVQLCCAGTAVAQWLRCCATNRKVAGSIPDGFIGIFH